MSAALSASYGGARWRPRVQTHREDIQAGVVWHPCGVKSEVTRLREVLLAWPERGWFPDGDPDSFLFLDWPDIDLLQAQAAALGSYFESKGVTVQWARQTGALPNYLFQRDLFFMTPDGAILARPGSEQRQCEARQAAETLSALGVPILATPSGAAVFEGADALWLDERRVLVGIGRRTNEEGASWLSGILRSMGAEAIRIDVPEGVQHLLGVVCFIDHELAAVRRGKGSADLMKVLREAGIEVIDCDVEAGSGEPFANNFVTVRPGEIVMPAECPETRRRFEAAGVKVDDLDVSQYQRGAGAIGCLTGILHRE